MIRADLTSLTGNAQQPEIDTMISAWNEIIDELYGEEGQKTQEPKSGTLTLATSTREYDLAADFVSMASPTMVDTTNGRYLNPFPGGYNNMRIIQSKPADWTGLPLYWVINPETNKFRVEREPTAQYNGNAYSYLYRRALNVAVAADTFPFDDEVTRTLVTAVVQRWYIDNKTESFNLALLNSSMGRAAAKMRQVSLRPRYGIRAGNLTVGQPGTPYGSADPYVR